MPPRKAGRRSKAAGAGAAAAEAAGAEAVEEDLTALVDRLAARFVVAPAAGGGPRPPAATVQAHVVELAAVQRQLQQRLTSLRAAAGTALERFGPGAAEVDQAEPGTAGYVEMKVQLLLSYLSCLVYYLLLKARGVSVREHPVVQRLLWIRTLLEKLRPVDQRLQYQIGKLLQWADGRGPGAANAEAAADAHALKPGELATGVEDEGDEGAEEEAGAEAGKKDDGVYRPPKIAQMEYTGDHVTLQEKAERDLARKQSRLERSEFMRSLREEFTDAPLEIHGAQKSAKAEKAARLLAEQREFEEDYMVRMRISKREARVRAKVMREGRATGSGVASLDDLTADFGQLARAGRGRQGRKGGSALEEYQAASQRARDARGVVASVLDGDALGGGKRRGGGRGGGPPGKKRRR